MPYMVLWGLDFLEGTNQMDDDAPYLEVVTSLHLEYGIVRVGRSQFNVSILLVRQVQILDGELPVPESHDDRPMMRFHSPVDDDPVAIEDASILHRVAFHVAIERSLRMAYVVAVEVQRLVHIVFCRTGESLWN